MDEQDLNPHEGRITRRRMLFGTAGAVGAAAFLAACGDDDNATTATTAKAAPTTAAGGSATTAAGGSATTAAGGTGTTAGGGGGGGGDLASQLGIEAASSGKGKTIPLGAVLALTGTGSFYGKTMSRGLDLAAKHIAELGARNVLITNESGCFAQLREGRKTHRFRVLAPHVEPVSAVGSGDVLLAGYVAAVLDKRSTEDALRSAVAAGTASTLELGAGRLDPRVASQLTQDVQLTDFEAVTSDR